jgi:DivIVA domain-containing protein
MAISPHDIRARQFTTVKRGGYDQREVEAFRTAAAEALEKVSQDATAMEARARAAVARLQELQQQQEASSVAADNGAGDHAVQAATVDETETISRTLLLAQRTADTTIADAEREAERIIETAKADSRKAGETERVRVEGEVQALLARRDFLESDVDQLEHFLAAQRERLTAVAADLTDVTTRVGNGLGEMRPPQLSASDADHTGEVAAPSDAAAEAEGQGDEADVAELIEQVGSSGTDDGEEAEPADGGEQRHSLFTADEPQ